MSDINILQDNDIQEETEEVVKEPPLFKVILHNDDYTTMDFVVEILEDIFHKDPAEASFIMLTVHHTGKGVCGLYVREIAETKINAVHARARQAGFPLRASMEKA